MAFRISGLSPKQFIPLYGLPDSKLHELGIIRYLVDDYPGYPDRIKMHDARPGETVLLLNHVCQPARSPYHASHAIFILEGACESYSETNKIPQVMQIRVQSLRAFDEKGMMVDADIADGEEHIIDTITRFFENDQTFCIHAHNAKQGCYAGLIERA